MTKIEHEGKEVTFKNFKVEEAIGKDSLALNIALGCLFNKQEEDGLLCSIGLFVFLSPAVTKLQWTVMEEAEFSRRLTEQIERLKPGTVKKSVAEIIALLLACKYIERVGETRLAPKPFLLMSFLKSPGFVLGPPPKEEKP